jgi:hypothetical protein
MIMVQKQICQHTDFPRYRRYCCEHLLVTLISMCQAMPCLVSRDQPKLQLSRLPVLCQLDTSIWKAPGIHSSPLSAPIVPLLANFVSVATSLALPEQLYPQVRCHPTACIYAGGESHHNRDSWSSAETMPNATS